VLDHSTSNMSDPECVPQTMVARCAMVSGGFWAIEDRDVYYLSGLNSDLTRWRSILQALGLTVFTGLDRHDLGETPLIILDSQSWEQDNWAGKINAMRASYPEAAVCVLTGFAPHCPDPDDFEYLEFNDARDVLVAAGISFVSIEG